MARARLAPSTGAMTILRMLVFALVSSMALLAENVAADLPFTVSYPQQCTTLNVTFTPHSSGFPYSVYILSVGAMVESYRINQDYQSTKEFTFQWQVPQPTSVFSSFVVAITDSLGNGNSTGVLPVDTSGGSDNCQAYAATSAFNFAGDSTTGTITDRVQCGTVRYYPVQPPFRGTAPFSISLVPLHGTPVTVNVPSSALKNESYFIYESKIPFAAGTQFYTFMSDATGGGSGGGSPITSTLPSSDTSCLNNALSNENTTNSMPIGATTAVFQNLAGALTGPKNSTKSSGSGASSGASGSGSSNGGKNIGGLIGGIIGAVIGVCAILLFVALFVLYRRRQRRKAELERKEQPQFIDLDDDDDDAGTALAGMGASSRGTRRQQSSRVDSFAVSPFTYEPSQQQPGATNEVMMSNRHSHADDAAALGPGATGRAMSATSGTGSEFDAPYNALYGNHNAHSFYNSTAPYLAPPTSGAQARNANYDASRRGSTTAHGTESELVSVYSSGANAQTGGRRPSSGVSGGPGSPRASGGYVLRTRNDDEAAQTGEGASQGQAPALPRKGELYPGSAQEDDADGSRTAARVMQHTDAGGVEELPPSYGQWNRGMQPDQR